MTFTLPDRSVIQSIARELDQPMDDASADRLREFMGPFELAYRYLEQTSPELPRVNYAAREFRFPEPRENRLGAWYVRSNIPGATCGPLHGKRIVVKDNILLARIPMSYGTDLLGDYQPEFDATVITRVLDAGATITGKTVCEYLCLHGGSTTSSTGFVRNPHNPEYSAGGSSSGSAVLVVTGEADMALGTDQAGSIRIPCSWSGAVGMKPTHGLVPYTGIAGLEASVDHVGPITSNVPDNALLLEVIAGADNTDGRQRDVRTHRYTEAPGKPVTGLKIGVLKEAFEHEHASPDVNECVRLAADGFRKLGADVCEVSIPLHLAGIAVWSGVILESVWQSLKMGGVNFNVDGIYSPAFVEAMRGWLSRAGDLPVNIVMVMVFGRYLEQFGGRYTALARNLLPRLRRAYDEVFASCDLLLLPTTIIQASRLPESADALSDEHIIRDLFGTSGNTCQFDVTGHPALSLPCGTRNGLPVGMTLAAKHWDESSIYRAAAAFEQVQEAA